MRLETRDLAVGRGDRVLVRGLNWVVQPGERWAIFGPNGAGKTSLLWTLCRALSPISGSVLLDDRNLESLAELELARAMALVPQTERPQFAFSVRELAAFGRMPYSRGPWETEEDWRIIDESLARLGLTELANESVLRISGGQLQLAVAARALAQKASILLLDEPSASLDYARHSALSSALIEESTRGASIILTSHDLNWALTLATHCLILLPEGAWWIGPPESALDPLANALGVGLIHPIGEERRVLPTG